MTVYTTFQVKKEIHRKVKIAAALAGLNVMEWLDKMATQAIEHDERHFQLPSPNPTVEAQEHCS